MTNTTRAAFAISALSGLLSLSAPGQPQSPPPEPPPGDRQADDGGRAPADFRARLEQRLSEINDEQGRLRKAIDMLDKGASPEDVKRELRPTPPEGEGPETGERPRDRWRDRREGPGGDDRPPPPGPDGSDRPREAGRPDGRDPAQRERVVAFLRENLPEVSARFEKFRASNPEAADRIASRVGPRIREIMELRDREPELARLKLAELGNGLAIIDAFWQAHGAKDDAEKQAARQRLAARVGDQFDIRAKMRRREIERLRERLDKLQAELEQQAARRDDDIQKRTDELMSGKAPMDLFSDGPGKGPRPGPGGRDRPDGPPGQDRPRGDEPPPPHDPK